MTWYDGVINDCVSCCVQGTELTAYDLARAKGHAQCDQLLQQHAAKSAVECRASKVRREARWVVERALDVAARDAQYWITDELELQRRAAQLVTVTISNATASLTALRTDDSVSNSRDIDDDDNKPRPIKVWMNFSDSLIF